MVVQRLVWSRDQCIDYLICYSGILHSTGKERRATQGQVTGSFMVAVAVSSNVNIVCCIVIDIAHIVRELESLVEKFRSECAFIKQF